MEKNDYADDLRIDEEMLEFEWQDQPVKMMKYCAVLADALKAFDFAKENLDIEKANLDKAIRTSPADYGIEGKLTETLVDNTITLQATYQAANHAYIEAKYEAEMAKGAVRSMDQRKDALENFVKLHGQSYFAGPKVPHNLAEIKFKRSQQNLPPAPQIKRTVK
jgi:hypothetical protein